MAPLGEAGTAPWPRPARRARPMLPGRRMKPSKVALVLAASSLAWIPWAAGCSDRGSNDVEAAAVATGGAGRGGGTGGTGDAAGETGDTGGRGGSAGTRSRGGSAGTGANGGSPGAGGGGAGRAPASGGATETLACEPDAADAECATCSRSRCCPELEAYVDAPDAAAFDDCIEPCTDQACVDACAAKSRTAGTAYGDLGDCQLEVCAEPCICEASDDDSTCLACAKVHCCPELLPYALAADFDAFSTCMEPCADRGCADGCIADFPEAGAAYAEYSDCALGACPAECE